MLGTILKAPAKAVWQAAELVERRKLARRLRTLEIEGSGITVVAIVKNEAMRLPYFFQYYRQMGVGRFIVLDHGSDDGTALEIAAEPLATRIPISGNFAYKSAWLTAVLDRFCGDCWTLVLDADEFLVYPEMDRVSLEQLIDVLGTTGSDVLMCKLLDMYPEGEILEAGYEKHQDPLEVSPFFDRSGGGVREKVFGVSPELKKAPFFRYGKGRRLMKGQHYLFGGHASEIRGCLLHFKFLQDFEFKTNSNGLLRVVDVYYHRELKAYEARLEDSPSLALHSEVSTRYTGAAQLVELGHMTTTPELRAAADALSAP